MKITLLDKFNETYLQPEEYSCNQKEYDYVINHPFLKTGKLSTKVVLSLLGDYHTEQKDYNEARKYFSGATHIYQQELKNKPSTTLTDEHKELYKGYILNKINCFIGEKIPYVKKTLERFLTKEFYDEKQNRKDFLTKDFEKAINTELFKYKLKLPLLKGQSTQPIQLTINLTKISDSPKNNQQKSGGKPPTPTTSDNKKIFLNKFKNYYKRIFSTYIKHAGENTHLDFYLDEDPVASNPNTDYKIVEFSDSKMLRKEIPELFKGRSPTKPRVVYYYLRDKEKWFSYDNISYSYQKEKNKKLIGLLALILNNPEKLTKLSEQERKNIRQSLLDQHTKHLQYPRFAKNRSKSSVIEIAVEITTGGHESKNKEIKLFEYDFKLLKSLRFDRSSELYKEIYSDLLECTHPAFKKQKTLITETLLKLKKHPNLGDYSWSKRILFGKSFKGYKIYQWSKEGGCTIDTKELKKFVDEKILSPLSQKQLPQKPKHNPNTLFGKVNKDVKDEKGEKKPDVPNQEIPGAHMG